MCGAASMAFLECSFACGARTSGGSPARAVGQCEFAVFLGALAASAMAPEHCSHV